MKPLILDLALTLMVSLAPERGTPENKIPNLPTGETNWGVLTQSGAAGRRIAIEGHEQWSATGEVRADGSVFILWILNVDGRPAPGVYRLENGSLVGQWGWADGVVIEPDGSISGALSQDTIRREAK